MDRTQLETAIGEALADSVHLVLTRALDEIGPCTYALYMPLYVKTKVHLAHVDRWYWQWGGGDDYRAPEPIYLHNPPGWRLGRRDYDAYRRDLEERLVELHARMYRQPCLLCETCQHRKKLWQNSPFNLLGMPLTQRSQTLVQRLSAK